MEVNFLPGQKGVCACVRACVRVCVCVCGASRISRSYEAELSLVYIFILLLLLLLLLLCRGPFRHAFTNAEYLSGVRSEPPLQSAGTRLLFSSVC